jgi:renalase
VNDKVLQRIAVIGAGIAGAACARTLRLAGHSVHVFDKSRGPGGRLATRRVDWVDIDGQPHTTSIDHGALAITARSGAFQAFVSSCARAGWLTEWHPTVAPDSLMLDDDGPPHLPVPEWPTLCREMLAGIDASWSFTVDGLYNGPQGWQVLARGEAHPATFDAIVLALPPAQAAPLLGPHRHDWARQAAIAPMDPCWSLMGIAKETTPSQAWDIARPSAGPLGWVLRSDLRPGRERVGGHALWVAHARAGWSSRHLERPESWVQQQLQDALAEWLARPIDWQHCVVHRWRYAVPSPRKSAPAASCWWDAAIGLGVCGDFLGGTGIEGAWLSAKALAASVLRTGEHNASPVAAAARSADRQFTA